ncbi:MAG: LCP family protein [Eggerthellaceae bacterium]|nr:LCP family protein [Eggerthellaceae bacterium]
MTLFDDNDASSWTDGSDNDDSANDFNGGSPSHARGNSSGSSRPSHGNHASKVSVSTGNPRAKAQHVQKKNSHSEVGASEDVQEQPESKSRRGSHASYIKGNPRNLSGNGEKREAVDEPNVPTLPVIQKPDSSTPYSRNNKNISYKANKHRKRRHVLVACLVVFLAVVLCGAGAAFAYINKIQSNLSANVNDETLDALESTVSGGPFYMVLLGTDSSEEREEYEDYGDAYRTDSMMLLRIDPTEKKVTCISIMRDLQVNLGDYGTQKINAAYTFGGASLAIQTISELADVPISHYAEINFDGFKEIVDAIGGIEVNVPIEINDDDAGGLLDAGLQTLNGDQALILCRSRYAFEEYGSGDEYRAANQRLVISAIASKILNSDFATMTSSIEALSEYVTTDMSVMDILSLANDLRGMSMDEDFYTGTTPTTSEYIDDIWWEILDQEAWDEMMTRVKNGQSPTAETDVDEATGIVFDNAGDSNAFTNQSNHRTGTVSIRNGADIDGAASEAAGLVEALGYTTDTGNANSSDYTDTIVVYNTDDQAADAQEIVDALGRGYTVQNDDVYLFDTDFLVVIGSDWNS